MVQVLRLPVVWLGSLTYVFATAFGIAALFTCFVLAFTTLKFAGAVYIY